MDTAILRVLASFRNGTVTDVAQWIDFAGSGWGAATVGVASVVLLMVFRRWRHLLVYLGGLALLTVVGYILYWAVTRPRPYGVTVIGDWGGFATFAPPVAAVTATMVGITYTLVPPGRPRSVAKLATVIVVGLFGVARLYLAVDHPSDFLLGVALSVATLVTMFRVFTPNEVFPVAYREGNRAHLDVGGPRGTAIRQAVRDQLGRKVVEIKPIGLEGSAGSTPLRLTVDGPPEMFLFAKLYARNHVRADRWYKLWRTILYGRLEDETSFQTVRRFVEYEDYTLRLLQDLGIPTPEPHGIVEITPEREYMITMEFFDDAVEISEAEVDDTVIGEGLMLVRKLWDAGIAHRDIKPANLMVRDSRVLLIDVFFVQVLPTPWRQAVDLANMMLVLALHTDAPRVYREALKHFTPDEIAEAFAATRGVASPTQLRQFLKRDERDLISEFRELAPARRPIAIQRWSPRRVVTAVGMILAFVASILVGSVLFLPVEDLDAGVPACGTGHTMILMAQAVPSATQLPCVASLPTGWGIGIVTVHSGEATINLGIDKIGSSAIVVTLTAQCPAPGPSSVQPTPSEINLHPVAGGCITYRLFAPEGTEPDLISDLEEALASQPRSVLVAHVEREVGLALCGAGAPCDP